MVPALDEAARPLLGGHDSLKIQKDGFSLPIVTEMDFLTNSCKWAQATFNYNEKRKMT